MGSSILRSERINVSILPLGVADSDRESMSRVPSLISTASFCKKQAGRAVCRKSWAFHWEFCYDWFWPLGKFQWHLRIPKFENRIPVWTLPLAATHPLAGALSSCQLQFQCGSKWCTIHRTLLVVVVWETLMRQFPATSEIESGLGEWGSLPFAWSFLKCSLLK